MSRRKRARGAVIGGGEDQPSVKKRKLTPLSMRKGDVSKKGAKSQRLSRGLSSSLLDESDEEMDLLASVDDLIEDELGASSSDDVPTLASTTRQKKATSSVSNAAGQAETEGEAMEEEAEGRKEEEEMANAVGAEKDEKSLRKALEKMKVVELRKKLQPLKPSGLSRMKKKEMVDLLVSHSMSLTLSAEIDEDEVKDDTEARVSRRRKAATTLQPKASSSKGRELPAWMTKKKDGPKRRKQTVRRPPRKSDTAFTSDEDSGGEEDSDAESESPSLPVSPIVGKATARTLGRSTRVKRRIVESDESGDEPGKDDDVGFVPEGSEEKEDDDIDEMSDDDIAGPLDETGLPDGEEEEDIDERDTQALMTTPVKDRGKKKIKPERPKPVALTKKLSIRKNLSPRSSGKKPKRAQFSLDGPTTGEVELDNFLEALMESGAKIKKAEVNSLPASTPSPSRRSRHPQSPVLGSLESVTSTDSELPSMSLPSTPKIGDDDLLSGLGSGDEAGGLDDFILPTSPAVRKSAAKKVRVRSPVSRVTAVANAAVKRRGRRAGGGLDDGQSLSIAGTLPIGENVVREISGNLDVTAETIMLPPGGTLALEDDDGPADYTATVILPASVGGAGSGGGTLALPDDDDVEADGGVGDGVSLEKAFSFGMLGSKEGEEDGGADCTQAVGDTQVVTADAAYVFVAPTQRAGYEEDEDEDDQETAATMMLEDTQVVEMAGTPKRVGRSRKAPVTPVADTQVMDDSVDVLDRTFELPPDGQGVDFGPSKEEVRIARLIPIHHGRPIELFSDKGEVVLGRDEGELRRAEVDARLSGRHCSFRVLMRKVFVKDLSVNGTYVNGVKLGQGKEAILAFGDEVSLTPPDASSAAGSSSVQFVLAK